MLVCDFFFLSSYLNLPQIPFFHSTVSAATAATSVLITIQGCVVTAKDLKFLCVLALFWLLFGLTRSLHCVIYFISNIVVGK